jgi:hypothetical protein
MDISVTLLCVGDAYGYIAVDSDGFVNPSNSDIPFLEGFMMCLEITHRFCVQSLARLAMFEQPGVNDGQSLLFTVLSKQTDFRKAFMTTGVLFDIPCCTVRFARLGRLSVVERMDILLSLSEEMFLRVQVGDFDGREWTGMGFELCGVKVLRQRCRVEDGSTTSDLFYMYLLGRSSTIAASEGEELYAQLTSYPEARSVYEEFVASS